jgi:hypothetical protein
MRNNPDRAEALYRLVETWAILIGRSLDKFVDSVLILAASVLAALRELRPHGPSARRLPQTRAHLSQPMVSKLESIGRHTAQLLPSSSFLYIPSQKPSANLSGPWRPTCAGRVTPR